MEPRLPPIEVAHRAPVEEGVLLRGLHGHHLDDAVAPVLPAQNTVAPPKAPVAPAPADPPAVLQLRATQTAWVEVVGRSGKLLIQRTLQAGETVAFAEDAPYAVVTGRADATEVLVRGQTLDLGPLARNNVARFSAP